MKTFMESEVEEAVKRALQTASLYYDSPKQRGSANFMAHEVLKQLGLLEDNVALLDLSKPSQNVVE